MQWAKLKPDYIEGMADNLDLIILGGYYGKGTRRAGGISHFLLGVAEKTEGEHLLSTSTRSAKSAVATLSRT